jgi:DNA-binding transcriptional ArsR family regulator
MRAGYTRAGRRMSGDPWALQRWAFGVETGNSTRKAVLSMLAMMGDASTGRGEVKQITLAKGVETSERSVRLHLKALEDAGVIERRPQYRRDGGRRGDEFLLCAPWVTEWPDGQPRRIPADGAGMPPVATGDRGDRQPTAAQELPPENNRSPTARARAKRPDPDALPDDFPAHLLPTLDELHSWLGRIADARGAVRPARAAIARAMMTRQAKGAATMLRVAERLEHWLTFGNGQRASCRDVVARWRDWLDQEPDVPERPAIAAMGPNVHAIRPPGRAIHSQAAMWDAMALELEARERGDAG